MFYNIADFKFEIKERHILIRYVVVKSSIKMENFSLVMKRLYGSVKGSIWES